jgi:hypothetical protein
MLASLTRKEQDKGGRKAVLVPLNPYAIAIDENQERIERGRK